LAELEHSDPLIIDPDAPASPVRFSILYRGHRFELRPGTLLLGRGTACQLVLDDPLVSRKHAQIQVDERQAVLEDLGSVNGVYVNGDRVEGSRVLADGDRIVIGHQELTLFAASGRRMPPESPTARLNADTLVGLDAQAMIGETRQGESEATHQGDALALLGGVVDKVLALGRGEEAERIIGSYLRNYLTTVQNQGFTGSDSAEKAVGYAVKLAAATKKGEWVDYGFRLYSVTQKPLPGPIVEQLYRVIRQVSGANLDVLRDYVEILRSVSARLGPNERFLAQRIEGLVRLASA
jgi:hypothetical protein